MSSRGIMGDRIELKVESAGWVVKNTLNRLCASLRFVHHPMLFHSPDRLTCYPSGLIINPAYCSYCSRCYIGCIGLYRALERGQMRWTSRYANWTRTTAFRRTSKRRRGYPSEKSVKRGVRVVHGDKELVEKLGKDDLCPCGSGRRFQEVLPQRRPVRRFRARLLLLGSELHELGITGRALPVIPNS